MSPIKPRSKHITSSQAKKTRWRLGKCFNGSQKLLLLLMLAMLQKMRWENTPSGRAYVISVPVCSFVSKIVCKCLQSTLLNFCFLPPQHCSASARICVCVRVRASAFRHCPPVINSLARERAPVSACGRESARAS